METVFYILVNMKTSRGWAEYGRFFVGNEPEPALTLFRSLKGRVEQGGFLRLDLMESRDETSIRLNRVYCTLDELTENGRIITKEVFKRFNLEKESFLTAELLAKETGKVN